MPIPTLLGLPPKPTFDDVVNKINMLVKELTNLMLNLDSLNVVSLTADHIDAGTLDANLVTIRSDLAPGAFIQINGNGMVINNGIFDTFSVNINGEVAMTAATIQTATGFPRISIDPYGNFLRASQSAGSFIEFLPFSSDVLSPAIRFLNPSGGGAIFLDSLQLVVFSDRDIFLSPSVIGHVRFRSWGNIMNNSTGRTLQQDLNALDARITALGG